jgi:hypothetical protein
MRFGRILAGLAALAFFFASAAASASTATGTFSGALHLSELAMHQGRRGALVEQHT